MNRIRELGGEKHLAGSNLGVEDILCLANGFSTVWQKLLFWLERGEQMSKAFCHFMAVSLPESN